MRVDLEAQCITVDVLTEATFGVDLGELSADFPDLDKVSRRSDRGEGRGFAPPHHAPGRPARS